MSKSYKMETNCTAEQKRKIIEKAGQHGMSVAEFLLFCALNAEIKMTVGKYFESLEKDLEFAENYHLRNKTGSEEFARIRQVIISKHEKSAGILQGEQ